EDGLARVWDAATGVPRSPDWLKHPGTLADASFSPCGQRLLTSTNGPRACIWDAATGALQRVLGHGYNLRSAEFSPDARRPVTTAADGTTRAWDTETGEPLLVLHQQGHLAQASFSPDGRWLVTRAGGAAQVWDATTGAAVSAPMKHQGSIQWF